MKIDTTFLRSKVARRIFILFISCALMPIIALVLLYYGHFTKQLDVRSRRQLHQTSKDIGMFISERLMFLDAEMKMIASRISSTRHGIPQALFKGLNTDLEPRFKSLLYITDTGTSLPLLGSIQKKPKINPQEIHHILSGNTLLTTTYHTDRPPNILMGMSVDPQHPKKGILLGEINPTYLWGTEVENQWFATAEFFVLDSANQVLFSTFPHAVSLPQQAMIQITRNASGQFEWEYEEEQHTAGYWSLFLKARYYTPKWIVVLSESKADVLAPATTFKKTFPFIILFTLLVVLFLSIIQIRRNLVPLEKLQEGTRHIARREFESRVIIKTGDEFEELAASFNTMAARLGKQFKTLTAIAEIDRSILSAPDTDKIIEIVLNRMHDILPCDCISATLFYFRNHDSAVTYIREKEAEIEKKVKPILPTPEEIKKLYKNPEFFITKLRHTIPRHLKPLAKCGMKSFAVFPLFINLILSGIIILGYQKTPSYDKEDIAQACQVADRVAVALSNARLIEELRQLHVGTLTALARAIDAKSRWTAGHSERVTKLALKIGSSLGLSPKELEVLRCGGLLHDIGKIGVPAGILDKSGKLTDIEEQFIREHVRWGARILEPIAAFAEIMPILLHHHEQFDGTGYPDGLAGEAISLSARIVAVSDAFDALTSHRPYRPAEDSEQAIEIIKQGAGSKFDPQIVQAFVAVMAEEPKEIEYNNEYVAESR
jgi:putative nucleotidyltransferase with HDIG domain